MRRRRLALLSALVGGWLLLAGPASAQTIRQATGANAAAIQASVDAFRADLGGVLNPNTPGSVGSGRREINWDGVPDADSAPARFPGDFFNKASVRGVIFESPGLFQVSTDDTNPTATLPRFGNLNPNYQTAFATFSAERLFAAIGSNVIDVFFVVPGGTAPATTRGFGAVFTDVDLAASTKLEFFDEAGDLLLSRNVLNSAGDGSLSFLGVSYPDARVARVRITAGDFPFATPSSLEDITQGGIYDYVVMDDFIYGEPIPFTTRLTISPPSGTYASTQSFDLVLLVTAPGRTITGGTITFDGADVGAALASCLVSGTLGSSGQSFRCPGVPVASLGTGTHTLTVTLTLDDGSIAKDKAVYVVTAATEP
jgi:hypothetical protein